MAYYHHLSVLYGMICQLIVKLVIQLIIALIGFGWAKRWGFKSQTATLTPFGNTVPGVHYRGPLPSPILTVQALYKRGGKFKREQGTWCLLLTHCSEQEIDQCLCGILSQFWSNELDKQENRRMLRMHVQCTQTFPQCVPTLHLETSELNIHTYSNAKCSRAKGTSRPRPYVLCAQVHPVE